MKEILFNLALIDTTTFCKEHKINCSGSHLIKIPRSWTYGLCRDKDGETIVTVTFSKNSVPTHTVYSNL